MGIAARRKGADISTGSGTGYQPGPIDMVHLARQTLGDGALERELLAMFRGVCACQMGKITSEAPADRLAMALHALKGAASGVGALSIAALARGCEDQLVAKGGLDDAARADLGAAVADVQAYIGRLLTD